MKIKHTGQAPQGFAEYKDMGVQLVDGVMQRHFEEMPWDISKIKRELKSRITDKRWEVETRGITLPNGQQIKTAKDDQARIANAAAGAALAPNTVIDFKAPNGNWIQLDAKTMQAIGLAVYNHVQGCFSTEKKLHQQVDALTTREELEAFSTTWEFK